MSLCRGKLHTAIRELINGRSWVLYIPFKNEDTVVVRALCDYFSDKRNLERPTVYTDKRKLLKLKNNLIFAFGADLDLKDADSVLGKKNDLIIIENNKERIKTLSDYPYMFSFDAALTRYAWEYFHPAMHVSPFLRHVCNRAYHELYGMQSRESWDRVILPTDNEELIELFDNAKYEEFLSNKPYGVKTYVPGNHKDSE